MGLRLGGSDRVAALAPESANVFQGKGSFTAPELIQRREGLASFISELREFSCAT